MTVPVGVFSNLMRHKMRKDEESGKTSLMDCSLEEAEEKLDDCINQYKETKDAKLLIELANIAFALWYRNIVTYSAAK